MKEAMASKMKGSRLARSDAIDHGRGGLQRKRESSNFIRGRNNGPRNTIAS